MSEYNWCHGTNCHKSHTLDRGRGSKGNKVLRTRKIKIDQWNNNHYFRFFCSQGCYNDFASANIERIVALAPRNEPLETPIDDPVREKSEYGYINTTINERVDTAE